MSGHDAMSAHDPKQTPEHPASIDTGLPKLRLMSAQHLLRRSFMSSRAFG